MLKKIFKVISVFISLVFIWFLCALFLPKIKTDPKLNDKEKEVTIYVRSNGVHTDIVMPRVSEQYDWDTFINDTIFDQVDTTYHYISIGWGDKGFYLDTPAWADLKCKTVVNALFGLGSTAMHVTYCRSMRPGERVKKVRISVSDYRNLIASICGSFNLKEQKLQLIQHPSYGQHDNYFEANGTYGIFKTCNVWTGNTLKDANIPMGLWTPLEFGVMDNL
ncbi:MAG: TIGR02117 family protein [Bacteroidota bacterium]